ncbi:MAG: pyridoxamine 5'-phosphate oxidase family protein [Flavobacteriaceae bacterium]|nr:pyridoxamine 5'-phosphate oxidase family protein [Flavobacteriaceae bacterium]
MSIQTIEQLRALYSSPSGRAKIKAIPQLEYHSKNFISKSPFVVISSVDKHYKLDASPRGGAAGFVKVIDDKTVLIPDAKGNNRLDSLSNIIATQHIGLLFMIPGVDETLRVNGKAYLSNDTYHLDYFIEEHKTPTACIVVHIEELFLHCAKAFMRSKLWDDSAKIDRKELPTLSKMLNSQLNIDGPLESQEDMVARYQDDL